MNKIYVFCLLLLSLLPQVIFGQQELLHGRRVLWVGTSITQGCTYPLHASANLGMKALNHGIGSSFLTYREFTPPFARHHGYSLSMTSAEKEQLYRPYVLSGELEGWLLDEWKWTSLDSRLLPYLNEVNYVIIDHGYNDAEAIYRDYQTGEQYIDWDSDNRCTFTGAFKYLMDRIHEVNPKIQVVVGGYFQKECSLDYMQRGRWVSTVCEWISRHYDVPLLDTWNYTHIPDGFVPNSNQYLKDLNATYGTHFTPIWSDAMGNITWFQQFCPDGVNPFSDPTGQSDQLLDSIFTFLMADRLSPCVPDQEIPYSLAVFGGSISILSESSICYDDWSSHLGLKVFRHGISGAGLSTLSQSPCIQDEVIEACLSNTTPFDCYLIWASSNDFKVKAPIGQLSDYTTADHFDESRRQTMLGGLNYCYKAIKDKNPEAQVLLFTSMPIFNSGASGYDPLATGAQSMRAYVDAEIRWCQHYQVPYLDLFRLAPFNRNNFSRYYKSDGIHLLEQGYEAIRDLTTDFLEQYIHRPADIAPLLVSPRGETVRHYNLFGLPASTTPSGFSIISHPDGSTQKIHIK